MSARSLSLRFSLVTRLGFVTALALVGSTARLAAEDPAAADMKTAEARKALDALLDRWNDAAAGDRLGQAVAICTGYLTRAKGDDKQGELDIRLELTRLRMAQNDFDGALKDATAAGVAASESSGDRKAEAKALYLLAFSHVAQDTIAKLASDGQNLTPEEQQKALANQQKTADDFKKTFVEQMKALSDLAGGTEPAKTLWNEQKARIATAALVNELGKPPKAIAKLDTDGKMIQLADYPTKNQVVLVDFWATWCGPCMAELPNVLKVYSEYHDRGLEIVGVSLDQDRAQLDATVKDRGMTWRQYFDGKGWENDISRAWGVVAIPRTYLIDHTGKVRYVNARGEGLAAAVKVLIERAEKAAGKDSSPATPPKKGD